MTLAIMLHYMAILLKHFSGMDCEIGEISATSGNEHVAQNRLSLMLTGVAVQHLNNHYLPIGTLSLYC